MACWMEEQRNTDPCCPSVDSTQIDGKYEGDVDMLAHHHTTGLTQQHGEAPCCAAHHSQRACSSHDELNQQKQAVSCAYIPDSDDEHRPTQAAPDTGPGRG